MNPIIQGIEAGYSPEDIIQFISKSMPQLVPKITKAMSKGYGIKQILGFLAQSTPQSSQDLRGLSEIEIQNRSKEQQSQLVKNGLVATGTAIAAPFAVNAAKAALSRSLPRSLAPIAPSLTNSNNTAGNSVQPQLPSSPLPTAIPPTGQQLLNTSQQPPVNQVTPSVTQPANMQQAKGFSNAKEYLEKKGVLQAVNESLKRGNKPDQVAAELGIKRSGNTTIDPELLQNIEEYAKIPQEQEKISPEIEKLEEKPTESIKIEKNSVVSSPQGVGEVKEIRNGQAIINVDGKLHKVKEEELEASPLPEKDLADLYDDLISGIEHETGEDVSRMVQWAGYNPETNTLQFLPHTGKLYKYGNISKEDAALLTDILSTRKTSGANFIGAWKAGSKSPIGAALSKLIRKLQAERGGKGQEYEETHEPIYSAYEPAIEAKKEKMRKKKKK